MLLKERRVRALAHQIGKERLARGLETCCGAVLDDDKDRHRPDCQVMAVWNAAWAKAREVLSA